MNKRVSKFYLYKIALSHLMSIPDSHFENILAIILLKIKEKSVYTVNYRRHILKEIYQY